MDRLLITADDFTGSLDTGIQFAKRGIPVKVVTDWQYDFTGAESYPVIVVDTESRPLTGEDAYRRVYEVTKKAREAGVTYFYKKIDSALRGNVGAELAGMLAASGADALMMVPAFPRVNRLTKEGVHFIDGVPVADSVFGQDPFEPVRHSKVAEILREQSDLAVTIVAEETREEAELTATGEEPKVFVFDVASEESLEALSKLLKEKDAYRVCSGCAGFAAYYHNLLEFSEGKIGKVSGKDTLLCLCGSVNPITAAQIAYAKEHGFAGETLPCEKKLNPLYYKSEEGQQDLDLLYEKVRESGRFILDTMDVPGETKTADYARFYSLTSDDVRRNIADCLGILAFEMIKRGFDGTLSVTGGDTLMGFMRQSGCKELVPVAEIGQGAVLCKAYLMGKEVPVISKSGGFGGEDIFVEMLKR